MHALSTLQSPHLSTKDSLSVAKGLKGVDHFRFFYSLTSLVGQPAHFLAFNPWLFTLPPSLPISRHILQPSSQAPSASPL